MVCPALRLSADRDESVALKLDRLSPFPKVWVLLPLLLRSILGLGICDGGGEDTCSNSFTSVTCSRADESRVSVLEAEIFPAVIELAATEGTFTSDGLCCRGRWAVVVTLCANVVLEAGADCSVKVSGASGP